MMTNQERKASILRGPASPVASSSQGQPQWTEVNGNVLEVLGVVKKHLTLGEDTHDLVKENLTLTKESLELSRQMTRDLREIMDAQKKFHQKLDDITRLYLGDRGNTCPKYIFIGEKSSSNWMKLKDAVSTKVKVHVHFYCEAGFDCYGPHVVEGQQGIDISKMKDWFKKIAPWVRFSLAILYVAATTASNIVAPGVGLIIPNFVEWQQTNTLANGIVLATGYTSQELDRMTAADDSKVVDAVISRNKQELRGTNRKIITELLGKYTPPDLEEKLGLRKATLNYPDGSHRSVVWICNDCFEKYEAAKLVAGELPN